MLININAIIQYDETVKSPWNMRIYYQGNPVIMYDRDNFVEIKKLLFEDIPEVLRHHIQEYNATGYKISTMLRMDSKSSDYIELRTDKDWALALLTYQ